MIRTAIETRRYLARMDTGVMGHLYTDCLVIGGGVAGLRAALEAAQSGAVLVLVKDRLTESNTYYAQGGVAAVLGEGDDFEGHIEDTLNTGCGLCDREGWKIVSAEAQVPWKTRLPAFLRRTELELVNAVKKPRLRDTPKKVSNVGAPPCAAKNADWCQRAPSYAVVPWLCDISPPPILDLRVSPVSPIVAVFESVLNEAEAFSGCTVVD